jgi:hypothetical protein
LASEDKIAIANIHIKKQVDSEQRKARKILKAVTVVVDCATAKSSVRTNAKIEKGLVAK